MNKSIKTVLVGVLLFPVMAFCMNLTSLMTLSVGAADPVPDPCDSMTLENGAKCGKGTDQGTTLFGNDPVTNKPGMFTNIVNAVLYLVGAISVLMLIYGGIRYTTSAGESANVTAAKNTILYAIVGIVVAILAYAIVNWVLTNIK